MLSNSQESTANQLLYLLQLASPALPVGAYSYSESLETLVAVGEVNDFVTLANWLKDSLQFGAIRLETALTLRAYKAIETDNLESLIYWNHWAIASKETEELRQQSWQMGRALIKLFLAMQPPGEISLIEGLQKIVKTDSNFCNYAIAFGIAAASWQIDRENMVLSYLHSWATNLINAGVKLIPLGQTQGQKLLFNLQPQILSTAKEVLELEDDDLSSCSWGLSLASMVHETEYSRLFRS
ncbi:MAG: urease accessory protein UreF [Cyanobacteriota bacterium]|nr:urease accessory protein UreF [Cyanobacteriota bacterium]